MQGGGRLEAKAGRAGELHGASAGGDRLLEVAAVDVDEHPLLLALAGQHQVGRVAEPLGSVDGLQGGLVAGGGPRLGHGQPAARRDGLAQHLQPVAGLRSAREVAAAYADLQIGRQRASQQPGTSPASTKA